MKILKAVVLFFLPGLILAQSHFLITPLKVRGDIQEVTAQDLDSDGSKELVVVHHITTYDSARRFMTVFWTDGQGRYVPANSWEMELSGRYSIYDFGALPGEKQEVLVFMSKNTAEYYRWLDHKLEGPTKLLSYQNQLIQLTDSDRLLNYDCFFDWNNDGINELLTLRIGEADMFYYRDGQWQPTEMELPVEVSYFSMPSMRSIFPHSEVNVHYRTPNIYIEDREADGRQELFAVSGNKIWIYKLNEKNIYDGKPAYRLIPKVADIEKKDRRRSQLNLQVTDVDGDKLADMVASYQRGTILNQKSDLKVYLGKSEWCDASKKNPKPDWFATYDAWLIGPFFRKTNNSRDRTMVVPTVASGLVEAAKILVMRDFPLEIKYFSPVNHVLPALPENIDTINLSFDIGQGKMVGGFPQIFADFNGDGYDDLILGKGDNQLQVIIKDKQGKRSSLQEVVQVPTAMFPLTEDLNGDKKDDVILVYALQETSKNPEEFNVLINKGGW